MSRREPDRPVAERRAGPHGRAVRGGEESLADYWVIEAGQEGVLEIAGRVAACTRVPTEVRQVMNDSLDQ